MKLPLLAILSGAALFACSADNDDVGSNDSDVTVHPTGDSTLGTFELVVPADLAVAGHFALVTLNPAPGSASKETPDTRSIENKGGKLRVVPGAYCLQIRSFVQGHGSSLVTEDCSVIVPARGTRTYELSRVHLNGELVKALKTQATKTSSIFGVTVGGDGVSGTIEADTIDLVTTKTHISIDTSWSGTKPAGLASSWPAVETDVPEGGEATLGVPSGNHIVKIGSGLEPVTLPDAVAGGGMHWRWDGAPSYAQQFVASRSINALAYEDLTFFDAEPGAVVFELGGIERSFPISEGSHTGYGRAIEIADVVDTDNAGVQTTVRGTVRVYRVSDNKSLSWRDANGELVLSFATGQSVHVWGWDKYRVEVGYSKNGIYKTYEEVVDLTH